MAGTSHHHDAGFRSGAAIAWGGWLVVVFVLNFGPPALFQSGQSFLQFIVGGALSLLPEPVFATEPRPSMPSQESGKTIHLLDVENRELRRQIAELRAEKSRWESLQQLPMNSGEELLQATALTSRILGRKGDPFALNLKLLIALGKEQGLHESELVLAGEGLLIDTGAGQQLHADQLILVDRSLLGRISRVGKQTSLVQPLTDASFRMAVRLYRRSPLGAVQGPAGILTGAGAICRIDEIPATEAVAVGDDVYTDPVASPTGLPIYCGRITKVDVSSTAVHWSIEMTPQNLPSQIPNKVQVLKSSLNPVRGMNSTNP